jgi:hypothetical protein
MPRGIGIILDGNRRHARKRAYLLPSQVRLAFGFPMAGPASAETGARTKSADQLTYFWLGPRMNRANPKEPA